MSETCETVKVEADNEKGFMVINKEDLTDDHVLFDAVPGRSKLSKADLKTILDENEIGYSSSANKAGLQALVDEHLAKPE